MDLPTPSLAGKWTPPPAADVRTGAGVPATSSAGSFRLGAPLTEGAPAADGTGDAEPLEGSADAVCPEALLLSLQTLLPAPAATELSRALPELAGITPTAPPTELPRELQLSAIVPAREPVPAAPGAGRPASPAAPGRSLVLDDPEAPAALAERISWLAEAGRCEARIELHPQELGAIQIRIEVKGGDTHVRFQAERPAARAALANALPQLRQLLAAGRLNLASAQVGELAPAAEAAEGEGAPRRPHRRYVVGILDELA